MASIKYPEKAIKRKYTPLQLYFLTESLCPAAENFDYFRRLLLMIRQSDLSKDVCKSLNRLIRDPL